MKLTGELKKKVEQLNTREEVFQTILDAGMELTEEELENIEGGLGHIPSTIRFTCAKCGIIPVTAAVKSGNSYKCSRCGGEVTSQKIGGIGTFA